jgi:hypothetical protein
MSTVLFTGKTNISGRANTNISWFLVFLFIFILFQVYILSVQSEDIVKYGSRIVGGAKYTSESYKIIIEEKLFP